MRASMTVGFLVREAGAFPLTIALTDETASSPRFGRSVSGALLTKFELRVKLIGCSPLPAYFAQGYLIRLDLAI
jgi:hypothetical protein